MSHCRSELHKEAVINIDLSSTCLISLGGYLLISETGVNLDLTNVIYFKKKIMPEIFGAFALLN